ncbi:MAG TPA: hypothetical protein DCS87_04565 [Rheinheimera sp.]|nr:hypothetical protein [Rheinheimera sp.]
MPTEFTSRNTRRWTLLGFSVLLLILAAGLIALTLRSLHLPVDTAPVQLAMLQDPAVQTPQQAQQARHFEPITAPNKVLGYGLGTIWLQVQLTPTPGYQLEIAAPFLDTVNFYQLDGQGQLISKIETGDSLPWQTRGLASSNFVFAIEPNATTWLLQVRNAGGTFVPIRYANAEQLTAQNHYRQLLQGFFLGILLFAALVTLVFGYVSRDFSLGWFALLVLAITAVQAELQGFPPQWLWPETPSLNHLIDFGVPMALLASSGFVLRYFRFAKGTAARRFYDALQGLAVLMLLLMATAIVLDSYALQSQLKQLNVWLMQGYVVACLLTGMLQIRVQRARAWRFLLPMLVLLTSVLLAAARVFGWLPENGLTAVSLELGTTLASMLMALSLVINEYMAKDTLARTQKALLDRNIQISQLQQAELARNKLAPFYGLGSRTALVELLATQLATGGSRYRLLLIEWQSYDRIEAVLGRQKTQQILETYISHLHQYCARQAQGLVSFGPQAHQTLYALSQDKIALLVLDSEFARLLNSLRRLLHQKYRIDGLAPDFRPRYASILIASDQGGDAEELIARASLTLTYVQRDAGHLSYQSSFTDDSRQRLQLLSDLTKAITAQQFALVYQPVQELNSQRCVALEAFLRWQHPTQGAISPALFIPLAEEGGLMNMITAWVYKEARRMANELQAQQITVPISINLSGQDLQNPRLIGQLLQHELQYPPDQRLWLEVAESAVDTQHTAVQRSINLLKKTNTSLVMDDFGAGQSMLTKLGSLPLRAIKLDMALLSMLDTQKESILAGAIELGRKLGLQVICEGVETQHQLNFLMLHNVDAAQGYLLARPMAGDQLSSWLRQQKTNKAANRA